LHSSQFHRLPIWLLALGGTLLVLLWQWATVSANYGGNWTALFCTGAREKQPPLNTTEHVYLFANSSGFDGQFYRYVAHDPWMRSDLKNYVDDQRLRYRRILVPLLAYGFALGQPGFINRAYEFVCLLAIGLGVYWSCRFAQNTGLAAAWGLVFLAMPAIPITADRLVVDAGLAALTAAFVYYCRSPSWKLFVVLMCAVLTRETGLLLVLAYCAYLAWRRQFRMAGVFLLSAVPAAAWYGFVQRNTPGNSYRLSLAHFATILRELQRPLRYSPDVPFAAAVGVGDYVAIAGALLGFGLALVWWARSARDPLRIAALLFTLLALLVDVPTQWYSVYTFGRYDTPMLLCLSGMAAQSRNPWLLLPIAMMLPRIAIQLAPQALGVIHWIM
jgi:hypothetical protein